MGFFSSKTKIYVSSSVWNMAGDYADRADVVPTILMSAIMSGSNESLGTHLSEGLRSQRFMNNRRFFRWARTNYDLGLPSGHIGAKVNVRGPGVAQAVKTALALPTTTRIRIMSSMIDDADLNYWAEMWVEENRPLLYETDWTADFDPATAEIVITLPNSTVRIPGPPDFLWGMAERSRKILFVAYETQTRREDGLWVSSLPKLFTYRMGTGNVVLDALRPVLSNHGEFYPAIPLRLYGSFTDGRSDYATIEKAFKKLTGGKIETVREMLETNDGIKDMDHIFALPAVSLNTKDKSGKAYLYAFFNFLRQHQQVNHTVFSMAEEEGASWTDVASRLRWEAANSAATGQVTSPAWDTTPPEGIIEKTEIGLNELRISMPRLREFDFRLQWAGIEETQHVGNANRFDGNTTRARAKVGSYWVRMLPDTEIVPPDTILGAGRIINKVRGSRLAIFHQYEARRYRMLTVTQLAHVNYVYGDKAVITTARAAMDDDEESGFLIPLHYPTLTGMNLVHNANLANCSTYLVINAYEKVKIRWYQRGIFKIILVVAAIAFSIWSAGASLGAAAGVLGTNAAVGAALGASVATAAIVGAVANGIAAAILTSIISKAAIKIFGDKWGTIIATIVTIVSMQVGTSFSSTGQVGVDWGNFMRIDNLMAMTNSVMGAISMGINEDTLALQREAAEARDDYEAEMEKIDKLSEEILGMTPQLFDPMLLTDSSEHFGERSETFLSRTLLVGSDLVEMSHDLISGFAELSLKLPDGP